MTKKNDALRRILSAAVGLFLFWQSFIFLTEKMDGVTTENTVLLAFIAWSLNMFITGAFAIPGFVWPTQRLLPAAYYRIRNPRGMALIYHRLGGELFRRVLLVTLWRKAAQRKQYFNGRSDGLDHFAEQSTKAEFGHLIPFVLLLLAAVHVGWNYEKWELAALILGFNILGNFYPILLQRYHRCRLEQLRGLLDSRVSRVRSRPPKMRQITR